MHLEGLFLLGQNLNCPLRHIHVSLLLEAVSISFLSNLWCFLESVSSSNNLCCLLSLLMLQTNPICSISSMTASIWQCCNTVLTAPLHRVPFGLQSSQGRGKSRCTIIGLSETLFQCVLVMLLG